MGSSRSVSGRKQSDTKRMRKYETDWGTIYIPLTVVEELGNPERVTITVESADGAEA